MRGIIQRYRGVVCLAVFLGGSAAMLVGRHRASASISVPVGYAKVSKMMNYPSAGKPTLTSMRFRYQSRTGAFRQIVTNFKPDGTVWTSILFSVPGKGTFQSSADNQKVTYVSFAPEHPAAYAEALARRRPEFLREERVAGYRVLVMHSGSNGSGTTSEFWEAPELNGEPLRAVFTTKAGVVQEETIQVVPGEPDRALYFQDVTLPVSIASYEARMLRLQQRGKSAAAAKLGEMLELSRPGFPSVVREPSASTYQQTK